MKILSIRYHKAWPELIRCMPKPYVLLWVPCLLSILAGLFEAVNVGFLLPMIQGLFSRDLKSAMQAPSMQILDKMLDISSWGNSGIFVLLVSIVFFSAVLKNIAEYFSVFLMSRHMIGFANNLRKLMFSHFLAFGKAFYDATSMGVNHQIIMSFTSRASNDLKDVQMALNWIIQLAVYVSVMFYISWQLAIFTLTIFPILNYTLNTLIRKIRLSSRGYADSITLLSKKTHNVLSSIALVKTSSRERAEAKEFNSLSDEASAHEFSIDKKRVLIGPLQEIILIFMVLLLVGVMALLISQDKSRNPSTFLVFLYVLKKSVNHFKSINNLKTIFASSSGIWDAILSTLDNLDKHIHRPGRVSFHSLADKIEIKNLSFSYDGQRQVLNDCSLAFKKGKMTALVGATGAGKSSIVQLLARFYQPPAGTILVDGVDINEIVLESYYSKLAIVNQDIQLMNDSIRFNVLYGLNRKVSDSELEAVIEHARLSHFVASLPKGLDSHIGDKGVRLSGGERQRLSIARALLKDPEILILDEATSALDSKTEREIQEAIDFLVQGKTSIVIAHRLSTIQHADHIVVLDHGRVIESGALNELLEKKGKFYEFWQAQKFE